MHEMEDFSIVIMLHEREDCAAVIVSRCVRWSTG